MGAERVWPDVIVLLPVYRPGPALLDVAGALSAELPTGRVVVVDDGSGPAGERWLADVEAVGCTVLRQPVNRGKGAALKTGFRHVRAAHPGLDVVTADADGQHGIDDIHRVAARAGRGRIVLGVRRFDRMPPRSRIGNLITFLLFRAATGRAVADTQTGLRTYPAEDLDRLGGIPGERFEFEMNVLLDAARTGRPTEEVQIPATYLDGNAASHFSGLADSVRIYRPLLRYLVVSLFAVKRDAADPPR